MRIASFNDGEGWSQNPSIHVLFWRFAVLLAGLCLAAFGFAAAAVLTGSVQSVKSR